MAEKKFNIYQEVTDRIIEQLKKGEIPWHKPWSGIASGAFNRVSKKPYSLLNQMLLLHDGEYATYKQWTDLGGQVRKGEKSEIVVFWKIIKVEDTDSKNEVVAKYVPILKYYRVFHISQVDGVEPLAIKPVEHQPIEEAESIKSNYIEREEIGIHETMSNEAYYSPACDYIVVPCKEQFKDLNEFYSTLFHEITHSTMHPNRLNRMKSNAKVAAFGSEDYSQEELTAELGSAMLMAHCGIDTDSTTKNSAAYIQGWLAALNNDNRMIVYAASKAEKSTKYVLYGKDEQSSDDEDCSNEKAA